MKKAFWLIFAATAAVYATMLIVPALLGLVFDYLENSAVGRMLEAGVDNLAAELVSEASRWTVSKSAFTTVSTVAVIGLLAVRFFARPRA